MTDFVITTENAADLPEEFIQENEIGILSLYYTIDGVTYGPDGDRLDVEEFYAKMRAGALPKTQQVNPDQAIQKFRSYLEQGKDILHLALTSAVSGSYNSAKMAAQELMEEFPERTITVIDTLVGTLAEGMVVDKVAQMRKAGRTLAEAARWVKENIPHFCLYATVDDLNHLYRGEGSPVPPPFWEAPSASSQSSSWTIPATWFRLPRCAEESSRFRRWSSIWRSMREPFKTERQGVHHPRRLPGGGAVSGAAGEGKIRHRKGDDQPHRPGHRFPRGSGCAGTELYGESK